MPDGNERARFFTALADHADDAPLVVALRADRLGEISAHPAFARLIERGLYLLRRMDEDDRMDETYCTGTYAIRDDRMWFSSERGWCIEIKIGARSDVERRGASTTSVGLSAPLTDESTTSSVNDSGEGAWRRPVPLIADTIVG